MKILFAITLVAMLSLTSLRAQEQEPLPRSPGSDTDPFGETLRLMPFAPETKTPSYGDPEKLGEEAARLREKLRQPSKTQIVFQKQQQQINMRQARIKAEKDPSVISAWDQSEEAATDAERRFALRLYYNRLFDRMLKIDGSLDAPIKERREEALGRLEQNKIRASVWPPEAE